MLVSVFVGLSLHLAALGMPRHAHLSHSVTLPRLTMCALCTFPIFFDFFLLAIFLVFVAFVGLLSIFCNAFYILVRFPISVLFRFS